MTFMTNAELSMIRQDAERMLEGPGSTFITIKYRYHEPSDPQSASIPFNEPDGRSLNDEIVSIGNVGCMQHIVGEKDFNVLKFGIVKSGECMFYLQKELNLNELIRGKPLAEGTMRIVDPSGVEWVPKPLPTGNLENFMKVMLGDEQLFQAVPCGLLT